ncbi:MAG TPA: hypothetical protein VEF34_17190 [Syntrophobacteraceae bacterium]|nr:hypothetical protein [Syntrophobacteraceae bacterium]
MPHPGEINGAYTTYFNVKEIGAAYGVGESAVTQPSCRVVLEMEGGESFSKAVGLLVKKLEVLKV